MAAFIQETNTRDQYEAAAGQTIFDYTYPIFDQEDLEVTQVFLSTGLSVVLTLGGDYTVTDVGQEDGTIILTVPASAGDFIIIVRNVAEKRITDFTKRGPFPADLINLELNRIVQMIQDDNEILERTLRAPVDDLNLPLDTIPGEDVRAGRVLAFDDVTGQPKAGANNDVLESLVAGSSGLAFPVNLAALRAIPTPADNVSFIVLGQISSLGGGGGTYTFVEGSGATDNNDTIVRPDTGGGAYFLQDGHFTEVNSSGPVAGPNGDFDEVDGILGANDPAAANVTSLDSSGPVSGTEGDFDEVDGILGANTPAAANVTSLDSSGDVNGVGGNFTGPVTKRGTHPVVSAYNNSTEVNVTGAGEIVTVDFDVEITDQGGDFSGDTFTSPIPGKANIRCSGSIRLASLISSHTALIIKIVTSNREYLVVGCNAFAVSASGVLSFTFSKLLDMDENDTAYITVQVSNGTTVVNIAGSPTDMRTSVSYELAA